MSSRPPVTRMSITQCRSALEVKARRLTWKSISKNFQTVLIHFHLVSKSRSFGFQGSLEDLIRHGLHSLRETLQQDKELTVNNTSIGIIGLPCQHEKVVPPEGPFRILEGERIEVFLKSMVPKQTGAPAAPPAAPPAATAAAPEAPEAPAAPAVPAPADEDVQMAE